MLKVGRVLWPLHSDRADIERLLGDCLLLSLAPRGHPAERAESAFGAGGISLKKFVP